MKNISTEDSILPSPYSDKNITKKNENKKFLLKNLKIKDNDKKLIVGIIISKDYSQFEKIEKENLMKLIEGINSTNFILPILIFLGDKFVKSKDFQNIKCINLKNNIIDNPIILAGVDLFIFIEKSPLNITSNIKQIISFGCVPIIYKDKIKLENFVVYNPFNEQGFGFYFDKYDVWNMYIILIRIYEIYKFSYDWNGLRKNAILASKNF